MNFERLATAKLNRSMLARVLDDLLHMSEGKEHASSLVDFSSRQGVRPSALNASTAATAKWWAPENRSEVPVADNALIL